jgi:hypothetical protein
MAEIAGVLHLERPVACKGSETRVDDERVQSAGNPFLIVKSEQAVLKPWVNDPGSVGDTRTPDRKNRTDQRGSNKSDRKSPD